MELKDAPGRRRDLEVPLVTEGATRLRMGRDQSRAQMSVEILGIRLALLVASGVTGEDACFRRSDGVV